ncbi:MAG TPA: FemAB family XrtA/PEP-CTERM system-associated protein [Gemmatimonadales bacterium]|nr:FemAB family XrtA/PEP-CTERM system-associated protein [Gemmatimonadales bacterium]
MTGVIVAPFGGTPSEWDELARRSDGFSHFHLYAWKGILERTFGHECPYLGARDETGRLTGLLPLVRVRSLLFGHYLVSMPFLNYGGPLGEPGAVQALTAAAAARARSEQVKLLELRSRIPLAVDLPVSHRKITVVLDLAPSADAAWKALPSKLRSQVKKPEKEGVTFRLDREQLEPFYAVFARHMRDLGTPTLPLRFFREIARAFPDDAWFGCAWYRGRPVACGAGFRFGREFEMTWASALSEYNRIAPNMGLYWAFMQRAIAEGAAEFNFGRCSPDSGTHRFKRQWGSRDVPLYWYQQSKDGGAAATPSPDQGAWSMGPRVWKRLPLPLANLLGPRIVRGIP